MRLCLTALFMAGAFGSACYASDLLEGDEISIITAVDLRSAVAFASDGSREAVLSDSTGEDAALFLAEDAGDGTVYLKNQGSGLYLRCTGRGERVYR